VKKTEITICTIGQMPIQFDGRCIERWRSSVFELTGPIENYSLHADSDGPGWQYNDATIDGAMPKAFTGDFLIAIVKVPLEFGWYARRISENRVVVTFDEMQEVMSYSNIPLHNFILRVMYSYTLTYRRYGDMIPDYSVGRFVHDETRGCLFDMNGIKTDAVHSCDRPKLCASCIERMRIQGISNTVLEQTDKDLLKIRKDLFYRISDYVKAHPLRSLALTSLGAVVLGIASSVLATLLIEHIRAAV